jgi:uncharacterized protein DUF2585
MEARRPWRYPEAMHPTAPAPVRPTVLIVIGLIAVQALTLLALGRPAICTCGTIKLWVGTVESPENSQQLADWYTFSHIIHGFVFYGLLWLFVRRAPIGLRLALAVGIEVCWEITENTPLIIERYRQSAIAQGYFGDSVLNSVSDTLSAVLGFLLARALPTWSVVGLALGFELFTGYMIRDNLTLNVIQLIHPTEAISRWQAGQ